MLLFQRFNNSCKGPILMSHMGQQGETQLQLPHLDYKLRCTADITWYHGLRSYARCTAVLRPRLGLDEIALNCSIYSSESPTPEPRVNRLLADSHGSQQRHWVSLVPARCCWEGMENPPQCTCCQTVLTIAHIFSCTVTILHLYVISKVSPHQILEFLQECNPYHKI